MIKLNHNSIIYNTLGGQADSIFISLLRVKKNRGPKP